VRKPNLTGGFFVITSEKTDLISAAFVAAHAKFPVITKDKWNPHFQSHYADLAGVRQAIRPILAEHGLSVLQPWSAAGSVVSVTTRLLHTSGQYFEDISSAEAKNPSAQAVGAAVTFICRYALVEMLDLAVAGDDDDGNSTQREQQQAAARDPIANADEIFDMKTGEVELAAELKSRNVPEAKWEAIGRWLHGKNRNQLSKAIASV
jgi:hypothetical protein